MVIGIVGSSHLSIVWSVALADKGYDVINVGSPDKAGYEPGLKMSLDKHEKKGSLRFDPQFKALKECSIVFMAMDMPVDKYNRTESERVIRYINATKDHLSSEAILIIMSQVPPGFTRKLDFPKERLFHQVDTLVFGQSLERALNPDVMVIGISMGTGEDFESMIPYYNLLDKFNCPKVFVTYEEAEIFKLAMNANLAAQIAVTNTMAELCSHVGAEWESVREALKYDKRIGSYLKPGLGIGGGHMERDLNTIELLSNKHGFDASIVRASLVSSHIMQQWVIRRLNFDDISNYNIAIWGLSYKEGTDSIKDSAAIHIINNFPNCTFKAHDPHVRYDRIERVKDPLDAIGADMDALLIMTPHEEYKKIDSASIINRLSSNTIILDPYSVLDGSFRDMRYSYYAIGSL